MPDTAIRPQPFVKWAGGKRSLLTEIIPRLPRLQGDYWEPFIGGGALFFAVAPHRRPAHISDVNPHLVTTYLTVRDVLDDLLGALGDHAVRHGASERARTPDTPLADLKATHHYYRTRASAPSDPVEVAARFIYLNRTCFNGLYRENSKGQFNVPLGRYANPAIANASLLRACSRALSDVEISHRAYADIRPEPGDFVYLDPPYDPVDRADGVVGRSFTKYAKDDFNAKNQEDLRDFALELHKKGVFVMLSNHDTKLIRALYDTGGPFQVERVMAPRPINARGAGRAAAAEVIIRTYRS